MSAQQNLVPNGSFEQIDSCHNISTGYLSFPKQWYMPTTGSSDYFNSCDASGYFSTPSNMFGYQVPFHGNAYVGFAVYDRNNEYSEYISVKLSKPLTQNITYNVRYYLSLSEPSKYAINNIGIYFDKDSIYTNNSLPLNLYVPQVKSNLFVANKNIWTLVESSYIAKGDERYINVGNFKLNANTDTLSNDSLTNYAYYFIDSIGVYENTNTLIIPNVFTPNNDGVNDVWKLEFNEKVNCFIYNRWGNFIFQSDKKVIQWDGRTTSGEPCSNGTYYYIIQTETEIYKGNIQLIR